MTRNESFKKRVRARMHRTGERYNAARRALLSAQVQSTSRPHWVSEPEVADKAVRDATGRGWDEWVAVIDSGPGREAKHPDIAAWLAATHEVSPWWSQGITVGYERITGARLPGQMPDGTFTVSRSRTLTMRPDELRALVEEDDTRQALFTSMVATRLSREGVKSPRFSLTDAESGDVCGELLVGFYPASSGVKFTISHSKIPSFGATDAWKAFWSDWLDALE